MRRCAHAKTAAACCLALLLLVGAESPTPGGTAHAEAPPEALTRLGQEGLRPETRAALVAELCAGTQSLLPEHLDLLLGLTSHPEARIDGAYIAACLENPAHIPEMFEAFLAAKFGYNPLDPDVFERVLRAMQQFPLEVLREQLRGPHLDSLLDAVWAHMLDTRLDALLQADSGSQRPQLNTDRRTAAHTLIDSWLEGVLEDNGEGLVRLQSDSGDEASLLLEDLQDLFLATLVESGTVQQRWTALQAARMQPFVSKELRAAALGIGAEPDIGLAELIASLPPELPAASRTLQARRLDQTLHSVTPLSVPASSESWVVSETGKVSWDPLAWAGVTVGLALMLWLLLLRAVPRARPILLRLGAVGLAPVLIVAAEAILFTLGVEPLMDLRPSFNPNAVPDRLFEVQPLEGAPYATTVDGRARVLAFPVSKADNTLRVVALGESSVHASYYLLEEGFPAVLGRRLEALLPDRRIEMINAGVGAALSDGIAHYGFEALTFDPDLLVLYLGNNDMTHFVSMAGFGGYTPRGIQLRYLLDRVRLIRALRGTLPKFLLEAARDRDREGGALDADQPSAADVQLLMGLAESNAMQNIDRLVRRANRNGVDVVIVVQGQNGMLCPEDRPEDSSSGCFPDTLRRIAIEAGQRTGTVVVDGAAAIRAHAGGTEEAGYSHYYDTIHPTRLGHAVLGEAIAPAAARLLEARQP